MVEKTVLMGRHEGAPLMPVGTRISDADNRIYEAIKVVELLDDKMEVTLREIEVHAEISDLTDGGDEPYSLAGAFRKLATSLEERNDPSEWAIVIFPSGCYIAHPPEKPVPDQDELHRQISEVSFRLNAMLADMRKQYGQFDEKYDGKPSGLDTNDLPPFGAPFGKKPEKPTRH